MNEFDIIKKFFSKQNLNRPDVSCSIGDDGAIVRVPSQQELVITTDTLISGIHFPISTAPYDIGFKSLAVNLSDLAAMGASPAWFTLALTLQTPTTQWLEGFSRGLLTLAKQFNMQIIGGDLTHGPLSITITAFGLIPKQKSILRRHAKPGDLIYVTGTLGDAGYALHTTDLAKKKFFIHRLNQPQPRIEIGKLLRSIAHAAIDISDGFAADLSHILEQSHVGAMVYVDQIPLSDELKKATTHKNALELALTAGDDYELCFTVPKEKQLQCENLLKKQSCSVTCVGIITAECGLKLQYQNGKPYDGQTAGYQHF